VRLLPRTHIDHRPTPTAGRFSYKAAEKLRPTLLVAMRSHSELGLLGTAVAASD
jgi:hypothetical protein